MFGDIVFSLSLNLTIKNETNGKANFKNNFDQR